MSTLNLNKIEVWNFGKFDHYELDLESRLLFIGGTNGSGKTTMGMWAPCWVMWGKVPIDWTKEETIRDGAKKCRGRLTTTLNGKELVIDRSMTKSSSDLLVIYDGVTHGKNQNPSVTERYLESMLPFDFKTFCMFYMSSKRRDSYKDLLHAGNADRFKILEDTLPDLSILNNAIEVVKNKVKVNTAEYRTAELDLAKVQGRLESMVNQVESVEYNIKVVNSSMATKRDKVQDDIREVINKKKTAEFALRHKTLEWDKFAKTHNLDYLTEGKAGAQSKLGALKLRMDELVVGEACPVCYRRITDEVIDVQKQHNKKMEANKAQYISDIAGIKKIEDCRDELKNELSGMQRLLNSLTSREEQLQIELEESSKEEMDQQRVAFTEQLNELKESRTEALKEEAGYSGKLDRCRHAASSYEKIITLFNTLKNHVVGGVRQLLINALNRYADTMSTYEVKFDFPAGKPGEFPLEAGMIVDNYYKEYHRLSEGQQRRVEICFLLAFQEVFGARFMLLDEMIFYGLDEEGKRSFCSLLESWFRKGSTIIVISQDLRVASYFDDKIIMEA